jgi:hypothetical protein
MYIKLKSHSSSFPKNNLEPARFEVLTAAKMIMLFFWVDTDIDIY